MAYSIAFIPAVACGVSCKRKTPGAHVAFGVLTMSGVIHLFYMAGVIMEMVLLYFHTPQVDRTFLIITSVALSFHMFIGNHMVLGILQTFNRCRVREWGDKDFLRDKGGWATVLITWVLVGVRCWCVVR